MEILNRVTTRVIETVFTIRHGATVYYYKEFTDERGKVIDAMLVDKDGYQIDDPILLEEVEQLVDEEYQQDLRL